ncbi:hypothetical protein [Paraflavitalea speifideaquila]|uniref:hypothetical protein n=1 Tax=Paraflavitalea speifideaquila TaxID=3076558 RepID=UPI0028E1D5DF|nr:hypothetical protein [Paraflavitalea speifideiaquila]
MPHDYYFRLATVNFWLYVFHHVTALGFIFYTLFLIKKRMLITNSASSEKVGNCTGVTWK